MGTLDNVLIRKASHQYSHFPAMCKALASLSPLLQGLTLIHAHVCQHHAGFKLEKALAHFSIDVRGLTALDSGQSTGGFTDCMLQNGAAKVYSQSMLHAMGVATLLRWSNPHTGLARSLCEGCSSSTSTSIMYTHTGWMSAGS